MHKYRKGRKDRYTLLSQKNLKLLRDYILAYKPRLYLFEGQGSTPENPLPYFGSLAQVVAQTQTLAVII